VRLAVLVFLKRARGFDAAEVAKSIFESYQLNERVPASIEVPNANARGVDFRGRFGYTANNSGSHGRHAVTREISLETMYSEFWRRRKHRKRTRVAKALAVSVGRLQSKTPDDMPGKVSILRQHAL